jgi:hypothetical protein
MLETATGVKAFSVGKPSPVMMRMARKELGLATGETIMIGDTMETDILGGVQMGYRTCSSSGRVGGRRAHGDLLIAACHQASAGRGELPLPGGLRPSARREPCRLPQLCRKLWLQGNLRPRCEMATETHKPALPRKLPGLEMSCQMIDAPAALPLP